MGEVQVGNWSEREPLGMVPPVSVAEELRLSVATPPARPSARPPGGRIRRLRTDLAVALVSLVGAVYLTWGLWVSPGDRVITHNQGDQALFEWLLAYQSHAVTQLHNPLWTTLLNTPMGVNLAVNTSMVSIGTLVAPVTLLLGASVAFVLVLTLNIALSSYAWYYVLSRHVTRTRAAAALGGLFCGFAPGIVSHANAHLNFTAQYLLPFIVWRVAKLREPGHAIRNGLILGVLVALDFTVGSELLLFVALACATYLFFWVWWNRRRARAEAPVFLRGLAVAGGTALVLLAYPLWLQFAGPQRYHGIGFDQIVHSEDLLSYPAFAFLSLGRLAGLWWQRLAPNYTEETAFFGPLLFVFVIACVVRMWRRVEVRALALTGLVFAVLSLGPRLRFGGTAFHSVRLPYVLLWHLPIFDTALPERLALVVIPIVAVLLALALDQMLVPQLAAATPTTPDPATADPTATDPVAAPAAPAAPAALTTAALSTADPTAPDGTASAGTAAELTSAAATSARRRRRWFVAVLAVALLPLAPLPLPTMHRAPVPVFFSGGAWRQYVHSGQTLVAVPPASDLLPDGQRWQTASNFGFAIPAGFFLGPGGPDNRSRIGPVPRPTDKLLTRIAMGGKPPVITDTQRRQARADLAYWHATVVVLSDGGDGSRWTRYQGVLLKTTTALLGPPQRVEDVWLWRVSEIPPA